MAILQVNLRCHMASNIANYSTAAACIARCIILVDLLRIRFRIGPRAVRGCCGRVASKVARAASDNRTGCEEGRDSLRGQESGEGKRGGTLQPPYRGGRKGRAPPSPDSSREVRRLGVRSNHLLPLPIPLPPSHTCVCIVIAQPTPVLRWGWTFPFTAGCLMVARGTVVR